TVDGTRGKARGFFRPEVRVAAGHDRDLRIRLLEVRRIGHAQGRTVRANLAGCGVARILDRRIEARERAVQLADRRRAEAFGPGAAQGEVIGDLPAQAE